MDPLHLLGIGHFHPPNVVDNRFLEELDIGTNDEWILERVGIRERRTVLPLDYIRTTRNTDVRAGQEAVQYTNVETGKRAAAMALERASVSAKEVGLVIAGGCCPEMSIPAEACRIAAAVGVDAPSIDVNSACSSFGTQVHLLASMRDLPRYTLIVNPENTTRVVDYSDRASCVLWGDGTSAAVFSREVPSRVRVVETTLSSSPEGWSQVTIPRFGHFAQEGSTVQRFAIKKTLACLDALLPAARARLGETGGSLHFIAHQANLLVLEAVARHAQLGDKEQWHNVVYRGNTGAAGAPTVLSENWSALAKGDAVILAVVGSGLTWAAIRMEID